MFGSKLNPCPHFRKCLHATQNVASLATLYYEYWSIKLLLKLLCWFPNCRVRYFWRTGRLGPSWLRMAANVTCSTSRNVSILNGNLRRRFSSVFIAPDFLVPGTLWGRATCLHLHSLVSLQVVAQNVDVKGAKNDPFWCILLLSVRARYQQQAAMLRSKVHRALCPLAKKITCLGLFFFFFD